MSGEEWKWGKETLYDLVLNYWHKLEVGQEFRKSQLSGSTRERMWS